MKRWESDKHKSCCLPAEGFRDHVATDGSLLAVAGKWSACGWSVVQLDLTTRRWGAGAWDVGNAGRRA